MIVALTSHPYLNTTVGMYRMSAAGGSRCGARQAHTLTVTRQPASTLILAASSASPVTSKVTPSAWSNFMRKV
jgi:hypothetical protein